MGFTSRSTPDVKPTSQGLVGPPPVTSPPPFSVGPDGGNPKWKEEFELIVDLISCQPLKTYVASPPELEMIFARTSSGQQPK